MTKHAILIGVNYVPDLKYLESPCRYACKMQDWARGQGFRTLLFADEPEPENISGNCTRVDILNAIRNIILAGTDQLLIYFSGHGYERAPGEDIWLLPGYAEDTSEAVSVTSCKNLAYRSGVRHVVFISDACRSINKLSSIHHITPGSIFPIMDMNSRVEVDMFYATNPGNKSIDVRDKDGKYRSIYSENLLECLSGNVMEVIREVKQLEPNFPAVLSLQLNDYLKTKVAEEIHLTTGHTQLPMGEVSSSDPLFLSRLNNNNLLHNIGETALSTIKDLPFSVTEPLSVSEKLDSYLSAKGGYDRRRMKKIKENFQIDYEFFTSDEVLENNVTYLLVKGINKPTVFSSRHQDFENEYRGRNFASPQRLQFTNEEEKSATYFVANNTRKRFYPISVLPGFLTQVVFEKNELLTVNYFPTDTNNRFDARHHAEEVAERKANIIMAAKKGIFQSSRELSQDGGYYRQFKHLEPTLGLFAAYAYFQNGDFEGVRSLYHYILNHRQSILGDISLLNRLSQRNFRGGYYDDIQIPLLTQGWSYLDLLQDNPLGGFVRHLQPGLWTSFDRGGLEKIYANLREI